MSDNGGFSKRRLERMRAVMTGHVEAGRAAGIVTVLARRGEAHVDAFGTRTVGGTARCAVTRSSGSAR